ncbi:MAG: type II secretion system protein [Actinomycetes bacterium]
MRTCRAGSRGFSLVELLVTIVLAGIIFAAMVPLFVTALQKTSGDNFRVVSNNILQDRIENIRLLAGTTAGYTSVSSANLMSPYPNPIGDGRFGPTYYLTGSSKPYTMTYAVVDGPQVAYKTATVTVSWTESGRTITKSMSTNVKDPAADTDIVSTGGSDNWTPQPGGYTLTASFKDGREITSSGVVLVYVNASNVRTTPAPNPVVSFPLPSKTSTVTWTGLPGGPDNTYTATCYSRAKDNGGTWQSYTGVSPAFHIYRNGRLKFDTNPGGS